jgi:gas vesicle protein
MRSITNTADQAVDQVKETAAHAAGFAKGNLLDLGTQVLKFVNNLRVMEMRGADNLLDRVGLQRRESSLRPILWFAAGAIAAGSVVLMLAPASGKQLRNRIARMLDDGLTEAKHVAKDVELKVEGTIADAKKTVTTATTAAESRIGNAVDEMNKRSNGPKNERV